MAANGNGVCIVWTCCVGTVRVFYKCSIAILLILYGKCIGMEGLVCIV